MIAKVILAACVIPIWPVLYFIIRNNAKPKKNIILGVTLPHDAHNDPETEDICRAFRRTLTAVMVPLLLLTAPMFLIESLGIAMTWWMVLLLLLIVAPNAVFAVYRSKLLQLKHKRGWGSAAAGQRLADVKAAAIPTRKNRFFWFLLPLLFSFVPVVWGIFTHADWGSIILYLSFALMVPVFWVCYYFIYHVRSELVNENLSLTMALTRVRRYNWSKFFLISAWLTAAMNLLLWRFEDNTMAFLGITLGYTAVLLVVSMQTEFAARTAQQRLTADDVGAFYSDEDRFWIWGLFYYNPDDRHFLVNDRVGMNMTVNLARPAAKVLAVFSMLCLLSMPFFGLWVWVEERTPATLVLSRSELTAQHTGKPYVIRLEDIVSVELRETLPSMRRTNGTGLDNLLKGNFSAGGYGGCKVCLQPQDPPFLVVKTGKEIYFLNDADSAVTKAVYDTISGGAVLSEEEKALWEGYNARAEAFVTAMAAGDFSAATAQFDPEMADALSNSALESELWKAVVKNAGAFEEVRLIENTITDGYYLCFVTSKHERSSVTLRITYSDAGQITGLFIDGYPALDG